SPAAAPARRLTGAGWAHRSWLEHPRPLTEFGPVVGQPAGVQMAVRSRPAKPAEYGSRLARLMPQGAPGGEHAPRRQIPGPHRRTGNGGQPPDPRAGHPRHRVEQTPGVRMPRPPEDIGLGTALDGAA